MVVLSIVLVAARQDHPGEANRSLVGGRAFLLATVRGAEPNKAGQPGGVVLLREREDGPWLLFA